eukprot:jgi/Hompol1/7059/HPOL_005172-RA
MTLKVGDRIPEGKFVTSSNPTEAGACAVPRVVTTAELFNGKNVVLFAVPAIKAKGIDTIACLATNDVFVMDAWGKQLNAGDKILFLADGSGEWVQSAGLSLDLTTKGMGVRSQRYALIVRDGVVAEALIGDIDVSGAESVLSKL